MENYTERGFYVQPGSEPRLVGCQANRLMVIVATHMRSKCPSIKDKLH